MPSDRSYEGTVVAHTVSANGMHAAGCAAEAGMAGMNAAARMVVVVTTRFAPLVVGIMFSFRMF